MPSPEPEAGDLTPSVGSETDISPLGQTVPKPAHEQTAEDERNNADWDGIAAMPEFQALLRRKALFIIPTTIFFLVYYFALPILVGWFPDLMEKKIGPVNLAYAFALSQFFMAWIVAAVYVKVAAGWDKASTAILKKGGN